MVFPKRARAALVTLLLLSSAPALTRCNAAPPPPPSPPCSVSLNTTLLHGAGPWWLSVAWACPAADASAFLALLPSTGAGFDWRRTSPYKLQPTNGAPDGSVAWYLPHLRVPYRVSLLSGGLAAPAAMLASSPLLLWTEPNAPGGVHVSLAGHHGLARVSWSTLNETSPALLFWPADKGTGGEANATRVPADSAALSRGSFCGAAHVGWTPTRLLELASNASGLGYLPTGTQHSAVFGPLPPGSSWLYRLGGAEPNGTTPSGATTFSFSMPPVGPDTTLRFLAVADIGTDYNTLDGSNRDPGGRVASATELSMRGFDNLPSRNTTDALAREVASGGAQLLLMHGDLSYARGFAGAWGIASIWTAFIDQLQPIASRVPLLTVPGNHESCWPQYGDAWNVSSLDSGGECGAAYAHYFRMPPPSTREEPWYSVDAGPLHIAALSTEHDLGAGSRQVAWLAADLAAASTAPSPPRWTIVVGHRFSGHISSSDPGDAAAGAALWAAVTPLLERFGVDAVLTGHHHSWQRTCPVLPGGAACAPPGGASPGGTVFLVAGHGGAGLSGVAATQPPLVQSVVRQHGYLRGEANSTALALWAVRASDGAVLDSVVLTKA